MNIIPPYVSNELSVHFEPVGDAIDKVERSGFISPDKKIESFIQSGTLLQNYRAGGDEYELQGGESEFEEDSPEYRDELTHDAESYDEEILPQYFDSITANEKMANLQRKAEENFSKQQADSKKANAKKNDSEALLAELADSVASKVIEKSSKVSNGKAD